MARRDIVGTWFPSGFHGHFMCKSRADFNCEYRHLAKPTPPRNFMNRMQEAYFRHPFSRHDNKNMFPTDLGHVAGIRKVGSRDPNLGFLSWHPAAEELRRAPPQMSMYKLDYHIKDKANVHGQKFVTRPQTSFDCGRPLTTMYRYSHGAENPNQAKLNALNNFNRQIAPTHKRETNTDTVASCMTWHWPCPPRRERLIPYNQQSAPYDTDLPRTPPPTAPPSPRPPPCTNIVAA